MTTKKQTKPAPPNAQAANEDRPNKEPRDQQEAATTPHVDGTNETGADAETAQTAGSPRPAGSSSSKAKKDRKKTKAARKPLDPDKLPVVSVDAAGSWVPRAGFHGWKSFGAYQCDNCGRTWLSAHAFRRYKQGCSRCRWYVHATYMWQNVKKRTRRNKGGGDPRQDADDDDEQKRTYEDNKKPHQKDLCEACRLGVCKR